MMSDLFAEAGERVCDADGNYLCTVARDIPHGFGRMTPSMFTDTDIDFTDWHQRLPVTEWFVRRGLGRSDG